MSKPTGRDALTLVLSRRVRSRKDQQRVEARAIARICLNKFLNEAGSSETHDCPSKAKRRGLCGGCISAFDRKVASMSPQEAIDYEESMIQAGLLLRQQEIRELREANVMKRIAQ